VSGFVTVTRIGKVTHVQLMVEATVDGRQRRGRKPKEEPDPYPNG
jgi:hypothetical protein